MVSQSGSLKGQSRGFGTYNVFVTARFRNGFPSKFNGVNIDGVEIVSIGVVFDCGDDDRGAGEVLGEGNGWYAT